MLRVKSRLESNALGLSSLCPSFFPFSLSFLSLCSHNTVASPGPVYRRPFHTVRCCVLSSGQQVLSHPWGRAWEAPGRHSSSFGATGSGVHMKSTEMSHVINRSLSVILAWKMKLLNRMCLVHFWALYSVPSPVCLFLCQHHTVSQIQRTN